MAATNTLLRLSTDKSAFASKINQLTIIKNRQIPNKKWQDQTKRWTEAGPPALAYRRIKTAEEESAFSVSKMKRSLRRTWKTKNPMIL